jgi:hypothetical protein
MCLTKVELTKVNISDLYVENYDRAVSQTYVNWLLDQHPGSIFRCGLDETTTDSNGMHQKMSQIETIYQ